MLQQIGARCLNLCSLTLRGSDSVDVRKVTDAGILCIARGCHQLAKLVIPRLQQVTESSIAEVGGCRQLHELNIDYMPELDTDAAVMRMGCCPMLRALHLRGHMRMTDMGARHIAANFSNLEYLDLYKCVLISDIGLQLIGASCHSLKIIDLNA